MTTSTAEPKITIELPLSILQEIAQLSPKLSIKGKVILTDSDSTYFEEDLGIFTEHITDLHRMSKANTLDKICINEVRAGLKDM